MNAKELKKHITVSAELAAIYAGDGALHTATELLEELAAEVRNYADVKARFIAESSQAEVERECA